MSTNHAGAPLKRTPLFEEHVALKGRMVEFGGWEMPVQYSGLVDEHKTVRTSVGLFDVSHMGEISVTGRGALDFLNKMTTNDLSKMAIGQAQYNCLPYPDGTLVDDIVVYRRGQDSFFICVNASNAEKDFAWLKEHVPSQGVILEDLSKEYAQIAIQGPKARELLQECSDIRIGDLKYYHFAEGKVLGTPALIARTGYTGELGYEIYIPTSTAAKIWRGLLDVGQKHGVKPCGLGARDTLRLEVAYLLYGNDMDNTTLALEAGLGWIVKFDKGDFLGRDALMQAKEKGLKRRLVGFEMLDKAIGRHGYPIFKDQTSSEAFGVVTSGTTTPTVGKSVGLCYLPNGMHTEGTEFFVEIRGERKKARVTKKPFYTEGTAQA